MPEQTRIQFLAFWNAIIVFVCIWYVLGSVMKAIFIGAFVLGSCLLGFGRRWLLRGGFALALFAIGIALGLPHPQEWSTLVQSGLGTIENTRAFLFSPAS
jgi:hypothetical protein